ncbi:AraC family transcriptional regulator [Paenibacillus sp. sptzw28]|uniref:AraC family transcriptional regulator n=1 Tax=Paenibacillus sp. sptzw28 TaxID=715179 RepID=UPI001C6DF984|nr:AraC family transcriptional regulator [Paenibacillus sp. sptzw28]QYR23265.1 AraC family transcriptional regulator [Paenibacillus sp. sptzw28]
MKPIVKPFPGGSAFPFSIVYKDTKPPQNELPDHIHDWHEIVYVYSGKGTFFINHSFYEMARGDLFLIPGNTIHRAFPDKYEPVTSTAIFFNSSLLPAENYGDSYSFQQLFKRTGGISYKLTLPSANAADFSGMIDELKNETERQLHGYRHVIAARLQLALLSISRLLPLEQNSPSNVKAAASPAWFAEALAHIDRDVAGCSNLTELAGLYSVSPEHFSRLFKQLVGMTFKTYINTKRMIKAKELLVTTDYKVAAIAQECGFDSLPHFHRMFKRFAGAAPAVYRQSAIR